MSSLINSWKNKKYVFHPLVQEITKANSTLLYGTVTSEGHLYSTILCELCVGSFYNKIYHDNSLKLAIRGIDVAHWVRQWSAGFGITNILLATQDNAHYYYIAIAITIITKPRL